MEDGRKKLCIEIDVLPESTSDNDAEKELLELEEDFMVIKVTPYCNEFSTVSIFMTLLSPAATGK